MFRPRHPTNPGTASLQPGSEVAKTTAVDTSVLASPKPASPESSALRGILPRSYGGGTPRGRNSRRIPHPCGTPSHIQRVPGMARLRLAQALRPDARIRHQTLHIRIPIVQVPMTSPREEDSRTTTCPTSDDLVIPWANWVIRELQRRRVRGPKCEEVHDDKPGEAPSLSETNTTTDGEVVPCR